MGEPSEQYNMSPRHDVCVCYVYMYIYLGRVPCRAMRHTHHHIRFSHILLL